MKAGANFPLIEPRGFCFVRRFQTKWSQIPAALLGWREAGLEPSRDQAGIPAVTVPTLIPVISSGEEPVGPTAATLSSTGPFISHVSLSFDSSSALSFFPA